MTSRSEAANDDDEVDEEGVEDWRGGGEAIALPVCVSRECIGKKLIGQERLTGGMSYTLTLAAILANSSSLMRLPGSSMGMATCSSVPPASGPVSGSP